MAELCNTSVNGESWPADVPNLNFETPVDVVEADCVLHSAAKDEDLLLEPGQVFRGHNSAGEPISAIIDTDLIDFLPQLDTRIARLQIARTVGGGYLVHVERVDEPPRSLIFSNFRDLGQWLLEGREGEDWFIIALFSLGGLKADLRAPSAWAA